MSCELPSIYGSGWLVHRDGLSDILKACTKMHSLHSAYIPGNVMRALRRPNAKTAKLKAFGLHRPRVVFLSTALLVSFKDIIGSEYNGTGNNENAKAVRNK
ncbi:duf89 domain-containing protein [Moniliophthora roreri]|nr:duf89 domain-containing protein [Moniliophthora roreri]